jgi:hypothetical protein
MYSCWKKHKSPFFRSIDKDYSQIGKWTANHSTKDMNSTKGHQIPQRVPTHFHKKESSLFLQAESSAQVIGPVLLDGLSRKPGKGRLLEGETDATGKKCILNNMTT